MGGALLVEMVLVVLDFEQRYYVIRGLSELVVLTLILFLSLHSALQNFRIDGISMEPGLHDREFVLVDKWSYWLHQPARGDIIVFVAPPDPSQDYVKRIIGLPGDVITIHGSEVFVNGVQLNKFYVDPHRQGNPFSDFDNEVVPPNSYFVLGDNRQESSDSRDWGCVPRQNIIGRLAVIYWPAGSDNSGFVPDVTAAYRYIPAAPFYLAGQRQKTSICPIAVHHT